WRIARYLAIDAVRRRACHDGALRSLEQLFEATSGRAWAIPRPVVAAEVSALLVELIAELPRRQWEVLQAHVEHSPERASLRLLRGKVSRTTGVAESPAAVRRALEEAKRKLRASLRERGPALEEGV